MSAAHTPGPWRWWPCHDGSYQSTNDYVQIAAAGEHVAQVLVKSVTEADLRLIAAAPELLAALLETLSEAVGWLDEARGCTPDKLMEHGWHDRALAAIAKATGGAA